MEQIKSFASELTSKPKKSETEKLLNLAINSNNFPSASIFFELSENCLNPDDAISVIAIIKQNLSLTNQEPNQILRTIILCEALLKLSPLSFVMKIRQFGVKFKYFEDFKRECRFKDISELIRKKARILVRLLEDEVGLNREREIWERHRARPDVNFLSSGEGKKIGIEQKGVEEGLFRQDGKRNWSETAKVQIDEELNSAVELTDYEKMLFVRTLPEDVPQNSSLFLGLKKRCDKKKITGDNNTFKKKPNFDIFSLETKRKGEQKNFNSTINIKISGHSEQTSLFGVPIKAKFVKNSTKHTVEDKQLPGPKLTLPILSDECNKNISDLLSLKISMCPEEEHIENTEKTTSESKKDTEKHAESLKNSNTILKIQKLTGEASLGNNHSLFDTEFPLITNPEYVPNPIISPSSLENLLLNTETLSSSLSRSQIPKRPSKL